MARNTHEKAGTQNPDYSTQETSFRIKGQIKGFPDKKKLKEFILAKPLLYRMLRGLV